MLSDWLKLFKSLLIKILYIYFLFLVEGIMGRQKLELLEDRDKTLKGEVFYTCFLKWRRQQENGLAQICKLAELLRDVGCPDIANSLQP